MKISGIFLVLVLTISLIMSGCGDFKSMTCGNGICEAGEENTCFTDCKELLVVCNEPYIRKGLDCCLDQNKNQICDDDDEKIPDVIVNDTEPEKEETAKPKQEKEEIQCIDECFYDSCEKQDYIECKKLEDGCKYHVNQGQTIGKCTVECFIDSDCSIDEKCEKSVCLYQEPKCTEIQVPYQVEQSYTEEVCDVPEYSPSVEVRYTYTETINQCCHVGGPTCPEYPDFHPYCPDGGDYHYIAYDVTNREDIGGSFTFEIGQMGHGGSIKMSIPGGSITKYIEPHSTESFEIEYCLTGIHDETWIMAKEIPLIPSEVVSYGCRDVVKTKTVTKYKTEIKCD